MPAQAAQSFTNAADIQPSEDIGTANIFGDPFLELTGTQGEERPDAKIVDFNIVSKNRVSYYAQMEMLERFRKWMEELFKLNADLPLDVDFSAGEKNNENDIIPSVFMGKLITHTEVVSYRDEQGSQAKAIVNHFGHLKIRCEAVQDGDRKVPVFSASGFINRHDIHNMDETDARRAMIEMIKTACLLVQHAKASGCTEVNFGRTSDPVKRYMLAKACEYLDLPCSEIVQEDSLPENIFANGTTSQNIRGYMVQYIDNIHMPINPLQNNPQAQPMPLAA